MIGPFIFFNPVNQHNYRTAVVSEPKVMDIYKIVSVIFLLIEVDMGDCLICKGNLNDEGLYLAMYLEIRIIDLHLYDY